MMYQFITPGKIGDYIIDKTDCLERVYEITKLTANVTFNCETGQEDFKIAFEVLDTKDPSNVPRVIDSELVRRATNDEVDKYLLTDMDIYSEMTMEEIHNTFGFNDNAELFEESEEEEVILEGRTTDNILDEYIHYRDLSRKLGDEDGKYKHKMDKLHKIFIEAVSKEDLTT